MARPPAKTPPSQARRRKKKSFLSDLSRWIRSKGIVHAPLFPLFATLGVVLVSLYIAVAANVLHTDKPDKSLLTADISWDAVFTQKTLRSVRSKMDLAETDVLYLYAAPSAIIDSSGTVTSFTLPLAAPDKERYSLWELTYKSEDSSLYLRRTAKNQNQKDLHIALDQLPDMDDIIKTFLLFPGKYLAQTFPLPAEGVYRLEPASSYAITNYSFAETLSSGTLGVWISSSGGGSIVDASFNPTGKYFTYRCTLIETASGSASSSSQSSSGSGMELRSEIMVMTELSSGSGIL